MPKVIIIILNWNGFNDTRECLGSLKQIDYSNYEIMVVDNGSTDGSREMIGRDFPYVKLIKNNENLGFAKGNNIGIEEAMKRGTDYILLLNNDVVVDPRFLIELIAVAGSDEKIGMANPKIYYYDKPDVIWSAGTKFNRIFKSFDERGKGEIDKGQFSKMKDVNGLTGCAMLIRKEVIRKTGFFNEDYFRVAEDSEYSIRVKRAGYRVAFVPASVIWHKVASSSGGEGAPQNIYYSNRNTLYLVKDFYPFSLPFVLVKYYLKYFFLNVLGQKAKAQAVIDAVQDFRHNKKGKLEKY